MRGRSELLKTVNSIEPIFSLLPLRTCLGKMWADVCTLPFGCRIEISGY